ncbi:hypothetical protein CEXT_661371 [Caerostris extrusa]|uniref:Uncharacterized protein n=1 Tax=Caerostris extrusa TaxID=172846 RepID=A0AAV4Q2Q1_CAEEX|nr:hypothetical protein CEXT_661371 [Caerostris extrusa]
MRERPEDTFFTGTTGWVRRIQKYRDIQMVVNVLPLANLSLEASEEPRPQEDLAAMPSERPFHTCQLFFNNTSI